MKEWYYIASDKPEEKNYFDSYDDTQFAILCIFRFKAPINEVPDYEIYHNGKLFETVPGDMLFNMYVENGRIYLYLPLKHLDLAFVQLFHLIVE